MVIVAGSHDKNTVFEDEFEESAVQEVPEKKRKGDPIRLRQAEVDPIKKRLGNLCEQKI